MYQTQQVYKAHHFYLFSIRNAPQSIYTHLCVSYFKKPSVRHLQLTWTLTVSNYLTTIINRHPITLFTHVCINLNNKLHNLSLPITALCTQIYGCLFRPFVVFQWCTKSLRAQSAKECLFRQLPVSRTPVPVLMVAVSELCRSDVSVASLNPQNCHFYLYNVLCYHPYMSALLYMNDVTRAVLPDGVFEDTDRPPSPCE